ncbi:MAG: DUF3332 family protein [Planctomycetota bacterium]|jgi:hypothetical protein
MKKKTIAGFVCGMLLLLCTTTSCLGPMNASSRVHTWNREIENRWLGEGVFLVFTVFWVNRIVTISDLLIWNSIEFWGGDNPIDPPSPERVKALQDADDARAAEGG